MRRQLIAFLITSALSTAATATTAADVHALASQLGVRLTVVDNQPAKCPGQGGGCSLTNLDLRIPDTLAPDLAHGDFKLFFGSVAPVAQADSDAFTVRLINGDLHVLEPRPGVILKPGHTYRVQLWSQGHFFSAYYLLPNMFVASGSLPAEVVAATRPTTDPDSKLELLPFVAPFADEARLGTAAPGDKTRWQTAERAFDLFAQRGAASAAPAEFAIVPTPASIRHLQGTPLNLIGGVRLRISGTTATELRSALADLELAGIRAGGTGPELRVHVGAASRQPPEGYRLVTSPRAIAVDASSAAGARYAIESLAQQAAYEHGRLRPLEIEDAPQFAFRGMHMDLARNFHSKAEVLKLIEQMGRYKLNKLHLHLGDDEGWRLQIASLPELTGLGAWRCYDPTETRCMEPQLGAGPDRDTPVNGFLSGADYIEILKAANSRGIEVIPSFDMPGHSRAAIKSMEVRYHRLAALGRTADAERFRLAEPADTAQYRSVQNYNDNTLNVCLDSTYRFIDEVVTGIAALHAKAGTPLKTYHIGADETAGAWTGSPTCQAMMAKTGTTAAQLGPMFIERVSAMLAAKHIEVAGWSDGLDHVDPAKMPRAVQSDIWGDLFTAAPEEAHRTANQGWKTVIAVPNVLYFDVPYAPNPLERGYDWPTRGTDTFKIFSFMPDNLAANAVVMRDIHNLPTTIKDTVPLQPGQTTDGEQGNLWSETVRRDSIADYMIYPRLLALAERNWHRPAWEPAYKAGASYSFGDGQVSTGALTADWNAFAARMPLQLQSLERAGVFYRIAPPGARISNGMLEANSEFPQQTIEYRLDGGPWLRYSQPVPASGKVELRTRSFDGTRTSRTVEVIRS